MVEYPPELGEAPREPSDLEVKYVHKASVYGRAALWTLGLVLVLLVGLTAWNTALIRQSQVQNHSTLTNTASAAKDAKDIAAAIHSCVTPGQPCFQRAQRRTSGAVSSITQVVILAAACSADLPTTLSVPQRQTRIQSCVIQRLAAHSR